MPTDGYPRIKKAFKDLEEQNFIEFKKSLKGNEDIPEEALILHEILNGRFFLTVQEVSLFFRISCKTVLREIERGNLKSYYITRNHKISLSHIIEYMNNSDSLIYGRKSYK